MNDDLISRQAAIDVIDSVFPVDPMKSEYTKGIACGAALAKTYVKQLPSAQPEVIRCRDCEWFRKEYGWNRVEYTVCGVSPTHHPIRREEDFCSFAERRTDG